MNYAIPILQKASIETHKVVAESPSIIWCINTNVFKFAWCRVNGIDASTISNVSKTELIQPFQIVTRQPSEFFKIRDVGRTQGFHGI